MDVSKLPTLVEDLPAYLEWKSYVGAGGVVQIDGLPVAAKSLLLAQLHADTGRPIVVVTYNADQAARLWADLSRYGLSDEDLTLLPSSADTLIFAEGAPDLGVLGRRTAALQKLARG